MLEKQPTSVPDVHRRELSTEVHGINPASRTADEKELALAAAYTLAQSIHQSRELDAAHAENQELRETALYDPMTGLLTKNAFRAKLEESLDSGKKVGLLFVDLNNFKKVNDKIAYEAGDEVIVSFANYLNDRVRKSDQVGRGDLRKDEPDDTYQIGRFGGDEFWISVDLESATEKLDDQRSSGVNEAGLTVVKDRIVSGIDGFINSFSFAEKLREFGFDAAVGTALPVAGESADQIITRAADTMKAHKNDLKR